MGVLVGKVGTALGESEGRVGTAVGDTVGVVVGTVGAAEGMNEDMGGTASTGEASPTNNRSGTPNKKVIESIKLRFFDIMMLAKLRAYNLYHAS